MKLYLFVCLIMGNIELTAIKLVSKSWAMTRTVTHQVGVDATLIPWAHVAIGSGAIISCMEKSIETCFKWAFNPLTH